MHPGHRNFTKIGFIKVGNASVEAKMLWLSECVDDVIYAINIPASSVSSILVGVAPYGLMARSLDGSYSLGNMENM